MVAGKKKERNNGAKRRRFHLQLRLFCFLWKLFALFCYFHLVFSTWNLLASPAKSIALPAAAAAADDGSAPPAQSVPGAGSLDGRQERSRATAG